MKGRDKEEYVKCYLNHRFYPCHMSQVVRVYAGPIFHEDANLHILVFSAGFIVNNVRKPVSGSQQA